MDRDTIIRLAREAGLLVILEKYAHEFLDGVFDLDMCGELERFAALVAAHEREACALIAERRNLADHRKAARQGHYEACKSIAADIRSRT